MIEKLFSQKLLLKLPQINLVQEIRMRVGYNIQVLLNAKYISMDYTVENEDILNVIKVATNNSLYTAQDTIKDGYISYFGCRIGLAGEGVLKKTDIITLKNIKSLCIRIPHEYDFEEKYLNKIYSNFDNTLIISKPGLGKTTLLRCMIKQLSFLYPNILVIDEKGEISFDNTISLGSSVDVILSIPKEYAYSSFIRVLRPNIIATDEVFGEKEINSIEDIIRCGVKVIATVHAEGLDSINQKIYAKLISLMKYIIVLEDIGKIQKIYDRSK